MTALLATAAAALFGTSDFLGGLASRRTSPILATLLAQVVGFVFFILASLVIPASAEARDLLFGMVAGLAGGVGVLALYAALATGRMSVVAPVTAALAGSIAAAVSILRGEAVAPIARAGIVLAIAAVVMVSITSDEPREGSARLALAYSIVAGLGFAASMLCYAETSIRSGLLPLLPARATSVGLLLFLAIFRRTGFRIGSDVSSIALSAGAVDAFANWALLAALRLGPVAVASVLSSLYPVTTMLLAGIVLSERVRGLQRAGVLLALVAVVFSALG